MMDSPAGVTVRLPPQLRHFWGGPERVRTPAGTLADVFAALDAAHAGLSARILDDQGRVRRHVLVFVNRESVRHLPPETVAVQDGDEVRIIPAVSGGMRS